MKKKDGIIIFVKVITKSSRNEIVISGDEECKIYVTDSPVKGKANKKVIDLLSKFLKISKFKITIIQGLTGPRKFFFISGLKQIKQ